MEDPGLPLLSTAGAWQRNDRAVDLNGDLVDSTHYSKEATCDSMCVGDSTCTEHLTVLFLQGSPVKPKLIVIAILHTQKVQLKEM